MEDKIYLTGQVSLGYFSKERIRREQISNAVVPNAKKLISRSLGGDSSYLIDTIQVFYQGVLLSTTSVVVTYPTIDKVSFTAVFPVDSFSGNLDRLLLVNSTHGTFSEVTGLTQEKSPTELLTVTWTITPN